jgi:DNA-binding IclR family transcriptional regulator
LKEPSDAAQAIGPVERVLKLLTCFHPQNNGMSLTELARQADLVPSTTSRLLKVLEQYGFVRRGPDRLYYLGSQIMQLGLIALHTMSLYEVAQPHLRALAEETGESVQLGILEGDDVLYIDQVASPRLVQVTPWIGRTVPVANTAIGAAIQGHLSPEGYTTSRHTIEPDVSSVAAPVFDHHHTIVGAINVIGPTYRISDDVLAKIGSQVVKHAQLVSNKLGATLFEHV